MYLKISEEERKGGRKRERESENDFANIYIPILQLKTLITK